MKRILLFLVLLSTSLAAQNWSPLNLTDKFNYRLDNDPVVTQTIWQTNYSVSGSDTIFVFNKTFCDSCITTSTCINCAERNLPRFFGFSLVKNSSGWCNFRNPGTQTINLFAALNDSWLFDTTNNVTAQVIFTGNSFVLGNTDSVKTILLSTGDTVQFSKNFGVTIWPDGYGQNSYYRLVGIHGRNIGVLVPRTSDYYDFQVGDMFEYESRFQECTGGPIINFVTRKYTITSRYMNADTIIYHADGIYRDSWTNYQNGPNNSGVNHGTYTCTITVIDSVPHLGNMFNGELIESENSIMAGFCDLSYYGGSSFSPMIGGLFAGTRLFADSIGVQAIGMGIYNDISYQDLLNITFTYDQLISPGSDTLTPNAGIAGPSNLVVLKKGLGQVAGSYNSFFEGSYVEHLSAYRKGSDTVGVFTTDDVILAVHDVNDLSTINTYPNPANDILFVNMNTNETATIELIDLQGKTVRSLTGKSGKAELPVSDLAQGMYILNVTTSKGMARKKVIISH